MNMKVIVFYMHIAYYITGMVKYLINQIPEFSFSFIIFQTMDITVTNKFQVSH